ncbi:MAG: hypothetical protein KF873_09225 [Gemmataceae bacterium]|nr:hypothetical protein [Gemmataceae bacterium]
MNIGLLREWLSLPAGDWPPDDRTLLGLASGPFTADEVEMRALAQMERLRPHQLKHADLVTEGMNRLAQALIALTDEANRANRPAAKPADDLDDLVLDADRLPGAQPIAASSASVVLEAEVVSAGPRMVDRMAARKPRKPRPAKSKPAPESTQPTEPPVRVPDAEPVPPGTVYRPDERRKGYAELVALRRLLKNWERLQPYFAAPSEPLATPSAVFGFIDSVRDCRRSVAVDGDLAWFGEHGQLVLALVRNPLALPIFRELLRGQRQELATDWARTTARLRACYRGLRSELRNTKPRRKWGATLRDAERWMRANPEWLMGMLLLFAVVLAFVRTMQRSTPNP